jgi:hypothetical protein
LWVALAIALCVRTVLRPTSHTVFPIYQTAVERWWADEPLYRLSFTDDDQIDHFRYPPVVLLLFTPMALLGPSLGGIVWSLLSLGVYGVALFQFARTLLPEVEDRRLLAAYLSLALLVALRGLWNAQSNALAMGLLLLGTEALARRHWWRCSGWLGGAIGLKLLPIAPALLLVALWWKHLTPRLLVVLAALGLLPFLTRPSDVVVEQYRGWLSHLTRSSPERWPGNRDAFTIWQAVRETLAQPSRPFPYKEPLQSPTYRLLQLGSAGLLLLGCVTLRRRYPARQADPWLVHITLAAGCGWLLLLGPSAEHASYAFLGPALAWALVRPRSWQGSWPSRILLVTAAGCILVLGWGSLTRPLVDHFPLVLAALPMGTLLFLVWLAGQARQGPPRSRAEEAILADAAPHGQARPTGRAA